MFSFMCPRHEAEVMVFSSDIDAIVNTDAGIDVIFHCSCGLKAVLQTGAGRRERVVPLALAGAA